MQMQIIRYNRVMFEMWLEKNQSRFLTVGIILLLYYLMEALKNVWCDFGGHDWCSL